MLNNERVQQLLTRQATEFLSEELNTNVTIEYARFKLFNRISLNNVMIEDQQQDSLLFAGEIDVRFSLLPMFENKFHFHHIRLKEMSLQLRNDSVNGNNFDFVIQALQSENKNKDRKISYQFKTIQLEDCHVLYTSDRKPPLQGRFDANNIDVSGLNAELSIHFIEKESLSATIENISFADKSGLTVKNLTARIAADDKKLTIDDFGLVLPRTSIKTGTFYFEYKNLDNLKYFADSVDFELNLKPSTICLGDLGTLAPGLKKIDQTLNVSGAIKGPIVNLSCPNLQVEYGNNTRLIGNVAFTSLNNTNESYVDARISDFRCTKRDVENFMSDLKDAPFFLPAQLDAVERLNFRGELKGLIGKNMSAAGDINTNLGQVTTNMSLHKKESERAFTYHGEIRTAQFQLGTLLHNPEIGNISFNLNIDGEKVESRSPVFNIKGLVADFTYKNYEYSNIVLNGLYEDSKFNGEINLDDENGRVHLDGLLDFSDSLPYFDFTARVRDLKLSEMNLSQTYPDMVYSFNLNINAKGDKLENLVGNVFMDSVYLTNGDKQLKMKKFEILSDISEELSSIVISSDFVNGIVEGKYNLSTVVSSVQYIASQYLPALNKGKKTVSEETDNNFDFSLEVNDLDTISGLLGIKWQTSADINIFGYYDDHTRKFRIKGLIPYLNNKKTDLSDITFSCDNPGNDIRVALDFKYAKWNSPTIFDVYFRGSAKNDTLVTAFQWNNGDETNIYAGDIYAITGFSRNENKDLITTTDIQPTNIIFGGLLWDIYQSSVVTEPEKITVNNFRIGNEEQYVVIDGIASKKEEDEVVALIKGIPLDYLKLFVNMDVVNLDGIVTGEAIVKRVLSQPIFEVNVFAQDFSFNSSRWGDLTLSSLWQGEEERLKIAAVVVDSSNYVLDLGGYVYPKRNIEMDLSIKVNKLKIDFIQPFLSGVMQDIQGEATCKRLKMIGPLTKPLFKGDVYVNNGGFNIDFLKTKYTFSDTVKITPTSFAFKDITIYDTDNNTGKGSGTIQHDSYKNFRYSINAHFNNILAMNTQARDNETFYGKVYASGTLRINGNSQEISFDIGMKTEPHTRLIIPFSDYMTATENNFITFIERPKLDTTEQEITPRRRFQRIAEASKSVIKMNLQVEANPNAEVQLIIDPTGGDMIKATGNGNLRVIYDEQEGMKLYGGYTLETGSYNFTLQNILRRDFKIRPGSSIVWAGSPYTAQINIDASYTVRASLLDLFDESELTTMGVKSTNVTVNCLLKLTGELTHPNIMFDIELPGSNDELLRRIKNIISDNEVMNRQMLYLLSMGRFHRPEYMRNATEIQSSNSELSSLVSSTVSAQLNNWMSQINENMSMGFNYYQSSTAEGDPLSTEVEVQLGAEMFNNRLIFNGNVGYRDDVMATSNFIGDFDLEYKLNKSGKLRAKAYSHTNDKYYEKNTTTQGAGIIYREEFDTFNGLMKSYRDKLFKRKKKKGEKTDNEKNDAVIEVASEEEQMTTNQ